MNLTKLKENAQAKHKENKAFLDRLKRKKPKNLDVVLNEIHNEVFNKTNCLECANCCITTGPMIIDKDIENIAKSLKVKTGTFIEKYLRKDEDNDWVFKTMPCPFLDSENLCTVYENRPKACREYPHTNRRKFYQINHLTIKNIEICPATFEIIEKLKNSIK
ncbi:MAG: YkgJ family cysteine cluster protein [Bacteroidetes bacterium]|nr:YkgJ family cysteine cluster protein [Bacteroidota bacterium]